ncbi:DUF2155 domain-containing protein [Pseudothioclava arenosa]|uniref:DUF2155 domain-containing protein n=1 Tax=Pseudothioclava arenosa TaxID=1795308 RepID=A0A2A4CPI5_9RHOB|nr:DUF2155 domain-containing protein [Pseudothioclava arenosa]PCD77151.1 hypothetical protein CLN94_05105 [Pseudothioclava arenosa]
MIRLAAVLLALLALPVAAQEAPAGLADAPGAVLRGLDKVAGAASDIELLSGQTVPYGQLEITLRECRYPPADPSSNAYAFVTIKDTSAEAQVFSGWLIADSPALSALDHQRYDVWAIRCKIE